MKVTRNEYITFWDVDDTIVMHHDHGYSDALKVIDPADISCVTFIKVWPNNNMIRLLKEEKIRGSHIVVWSRGGYKWAEHVILALKLENYVDEVMTKPLAYFDDKLVEEWLKYRVYLSPETKYKNRA
jgi:predicted phosphatase